MLLFSSGGKSKRIILWFLFNFLFFSNFANLFLNLVFRNAKINFGLFFVLFNVNFWCFWFLFDRFWCNFCFDSFEWLFYFLINDLLFRILFFERFWLEFVYLKWVLVDNSFGSVINLLTLYIVLLQSILMKLVLIVQVEIGEYFFGSEYERGSIIDPVIVVEGIDLFILFMHDFE